MGDYLKADDGRKGSAFNDVTVKYSHAINTIAVNSAGDFAVLGGYEGAPGEIKSSTDRHRSKKGLFLVNLESPKEPIKTIPQQSKWEVGCVEWNPHPSQAGYVASTVPLLLSFFHDTELMP